MNNKRYFCLIVDDEPDMCWALEHILERIDCSSQKALNGQEALSCISQKSFDLVFLDAKLPDIEGLELAKKMRSHDPKMKIVIVSGYFYKDDRDMQKALSQGTIFHFIAKPFNHQEICKIVEELR